VPRCRSLIKYHLDPTHFQGPTRPRHLTLRVIGNRRIAISIVRILYIGKPRMMKPRFFRFVPPVPPTIDISHGIGKSLLTILTCMQLLHSPTPICRCAMANGFYLRLEINSLATSPRSFYLRDFAILSRISSRRFSSSKLLPSTTSLSSNPFGACSTVFSMELPLMSFINSDSFRDFCVNYLRSTFNNFQVLKSSESMHSPPTENL
jgi:hypothetical protein